MPRPTFIYSLAASLDGLIADPKGGVKWLDDFPDADYGLEDLFRSIDTLVMGRKTYEIGLKLGMPPMGNTRLVVLSRKMKQGRHKAEIWNGTLKALVKDLEKQGSKRVWMMGGGQTAAAFVDAGLLDEVEIVTMPLVLGAGIPMFGKTKKPWTLELASCEQYPNGAIKRRYRVATGKAKTAAQK